MGHLYFDRSRGLMFRCTSCWRVISIKDLNILGIQLTVEQFREIAKFHTDNCGIEELYDLEDL